MSQTRLLKFLACYFRCKLFLISRRVLFSSPFKFLIGLSMADEDSVSGVKGLLHRSVPWFKSQLDSLVSAAKRLLRGLVFISHKKKRCSHCKHCTRAKAKDRVWRWRHRALPVALGYAVGTDQATKLDVWWLIFQSQCVGNEKKECWFVLRHVGIEAFYPSRFLCSGS
jgi:hypothetical protein